MAFVIENDTVVSFAEFQDVLDKDQRIFEANEGLSDDVIDRALIKATERILTRLRNTAWWRQYYTVLSGANITKVGDIPALDPNKIRSREGDFTDLCVFVGLSEQILPGVADFSNEDSAERQKMGYYTQRADALFMELVTAGDWYDFNDDSTIVSDEKLAGQINLKRVR